MRDLLTSARSSNKVEGEGFGAGSIMKSMAIAGGMVRVFYLLLCVKIPLITINYRNYL